MTPSSEDVLRQRLQTGFLGIIAFSLILFLLFQARFVLICLAIAIILFSLTSDAINAISIRLRVPNWLATTLALIGITLGLIWLSTTIMSQINEVVGRAIAYTESVQIALTGLIERFGPEAQTRLLAALTEFNITGWLQSLAGQASGLLSGSLLVILFVGFMFAERAWLPVKVERLTGDPAQAARLRLIGASIMRRVNRYLVVKTFVSALTALAVWAIFLLGRLELAGAVAWLTFVLNFIPNVGSVIAWAITVALAFVLTGDPTTTIVVGIACMAVHFVIGNILDPMLTGQTLQLSSFGIILSLAFWGAIWGIAGAFLAVPIMVAVMIVCWHVPWLRPVAILLSREGLADIDTAPAR
ncbi:AI-2E family transporter [Paracoccus subflavus]|uniref:AI-2E family transporter n=1 Tax=Paracoccus subflavus TaxID=2528244 RepID=UPI001FE29026|nr:AI-2E family transporter [Paracoccus subflavus]